MYEKINMKFVVKLIKNIGVFFISFICFAIMALELPNPKIKITQRQYENLVKQQDKVNNEYNELNSKQKVLEDTKNDLASKNKDLNDKLTKLNNELSQQ